MKKEKAQFAVLLDEFGGVSGIATMEDVVEEVVGSIYDEFDDEITIKKISDKEYIVDGTTPIQEINREIGLELDEENPDYDTVAGLLITSFDRFPKVNDTLDLEDATITVIEMQKLQIKFVKIVVKEKSQDEEDE